MKPEEQLAKYLEEKNFKYKDSADYFIDQLTEKQLCEYQIRKLEEILNCAKLELAAAQAREKLKK